MSQIGCMDEIRALMREHDNFIIAGHVNPDGDAVGACLGLAMALNETGKKVNVLLEPYAPRFDIIPGQHLLYKEKWETVSAPIILCVDCGDAARMGEAKPVFDKTQVTVCIDHHMTNEGFAQHNFIDPDASSASELIYQLILPEYYIDKDIATALYAGIIWDTGGLRFDSTTRETMRVAGELMNLGIPFTEIYSELMHRRSFSEIKLFGKILEITTRRFGWRIVYACVTKELLKEQNASAKDMEGVVEYLLNINDAEIAVLFYERSKKDVKASLRSRVANIGAVAAEFGGGGHKLAAGCTVNGDMESICENILQRLEQELMRHD
jgi:phosphoesterase RecJ-like protein